MISLQQHELFITYEKKKSHINQIKLGDEDVTKIYRIIVGNKHDAMVKNLEQLVKNPDAYSATHPQLHGMITNTIVEIFNEYDSANSKVLGEELYDLVVSNPRFGFNSVHEKVLQNVFLNIKDMIVDVHKFDLTNAEIIGYTLDLSRNALDVAINDTKNLFRNFNGDLASLIKDQKQKS